jgi:hypothetical protein
MEGVCWKEVRDGKTEIWQDDFGNLLAIPATQSEERRNPHDGTQL